MKLSFGISYGLYLGILYYATCSLVFIFRAALFKGLHELVCVAYLMSPYSYLGCNIFVKRLEGIKKRLAVYLKVFTKIHVYIKSYKDTKITYYIFLLTP